MRSFSQRFPLHTRRIICGYVVLRTVLHSYPSGICYLRPGIGHAGKFDSSEQQKDEHRENQRKFY